ncbi:DUF1835 domain-containing protein [Bacillus sp. JJ1127]|uniref:DUF1835 domain-containing protein n=1 Tax=Bacillus sp. JJ1127 TaxID=3122952 RepID=UPI002FFE5251
MKDKLSQVIDSMPEEEVRSLLHLILLQLELIEKNKDEETIKMLAEIPKQLIESQKPKLNILDSKHVHIAFGDSPAGCLKHILKEEGFNQDYVISFSDAFSVGPIHQLGLKSGQVARQQWLSNNLNSYDFYFEEEYLPSLIHSLEEIQSISNDTPITIWKADNAHEHVGLCFVLAELKNKKNIRIINTSEAHRKLLQTEYGIRGTGELSSKNLAIILKKYGEKSFLAEETRTALEKEWEVLSTSTELLRIWKDSAVHAVQEDYFDDFIVECAKRIGADKAFYKAARVIGEALGHIEQVVGDVFLEYRLQALIKKGTFEVKGSLKAMRYYSVMLNR